MLRKVAFAIVFAAGALVAWRVSIESSNARRPREYIIADERFTPDERAAILRGARHIAEHTRRPIPNIQWDKLPEIDQDMTIKRDDMSKHPAGSQIAGDCAVGNFWMRLDPDQIHDHDMEHLASIAAHEFGHAVGLPHLPEGKKGEMHPSAPKTLMWTAADEASCRAQRVCKD